LEADGVRRCSQKIANQTHSGFISNPTQTKLTIQLGYCTPHRKSGKEMKIIIPQMTTKRKFHERNFRVATSKKKAQRLRSRKAGIEPAVEEH